MSEDHTYEMDLRHAELAEQQWTRDKAQQQAEKEGVQLTDDHWDVLLFLRKHYLEKGLPSHARLLAQDLEKKYESRGGKKFLYQLFPNGPVTQGSHLANLPLPDGAADDSFGTRF